jgi:hypothetical protein
VSTKHPQSLRKRQEAIKAAIERLPEPEKLIVALHVFEAAPEGDCGTVWTSPTPKSDASGGSPQACWLHGWDRTDLRSRCS